LRDFGEDVASSLERKRKKSENRRLRLNLIRKSPEYKKGGWDGW